jgi:hypothetical protein
MDENGETPAASPLSGELNTAFKEKEKYVNHRLLPALSILTAPAIPPSLLARTARCNITWSPIYPAWPTISIQSWSTLGASRSHRRALLDRKQPFLDWQQSTIAQAKPRSSWYVFRRGQARVLPR